MISVLQNDLPIGFIEEWEDRIRTFHNNETVLPAWLIRFHCCASKYVPLSLNQIGEVPPYRYFQTDDFYWVADESNQEEVYVRLPLTYDEVDVYYYKELDSASLLDRIMRLICQVYRYRALMKNGLLMHSSSVIYHNSGVMFFGHSGAGKSTQAMLWKKHANADVLNYDQNYVYKSDNGYMVSSTPWGGKEQYYVNQVVPLRAIVFVQKSISENKVELLNKANGFSAIYLHNYVFPFENKIEDIYCQTVSNLVKNVPIYRLSCTIGETAIEILKELLYRDNAD